MLEHIILQPSDSLIKRIVILLHGYGSNAKNMMSLAQTWHGRLQNTLFVAPNGPKHSPHGMVDSYQWFDLTTLDERHIRSGLKNAVEILNEYIKELSIKFEVPVDSIALVGFSQGTMLSLETLYSNVHVGAIIGYSGALYPPPWAPRALKTPVQLIHGTKDDVLHHSQSLEVKELLQSFGVFVETYLCEGIDHTISLEGIEKGLSFLSKYLKEKD